MPVEKQDLLIPLRKRSLADEVVTRLREAILSGQFAPKERLQEAVLAEFMGVSRGPIREALNQLESEGVVIKRRNRGTFVARMSPRDAEEVYSLRLALEKLAVIWAIRNAQPTDLDEMQSILDKMTEMSKPEASEQDFAQIDIEFHDVLYHSTKHIRLSEAWHNLRAQVHILLLSRNVAYSYSELLQEMVPAHQEIVNAIRTKDEEQAIFAIEHHITEAYKRIIKGYAARESNSPDLP